MWKTSRPTNSLEWLRKNRADDQALVIVSKQVNELAGPVIVESGGVLLLLVDVNSELVNTAAEGRLDTGSLGAISGAFDQEKTLYVLATNQALPDRPDRVAIVARDLELTLYRMVDS